MNLWENGGFEALFEHWYPHLASGAVASHTIDAVGPHSGTKSLRIDVTQTGGNWWDVQANYFDAKIVAGESYTLEFWARSATGGENLHVDFLDNTSFATHAAHTMSVTSTWTNYSIAFTAPSGPIDIGVYFSFGDSIGTYWLDDASLVKQ